jgi:hypothetical protein
MKVFKMNDCDCVAAETKEEAVEWYNKEITDEYTYSEVTEIDIEKEMMWYGFEVEGLADLCDYCIKEKIKTSFEMKIGWRDYTFSIKMTFATALYFDKLYNKVTPYIISSTEY